MKNKFLENFFSLTLLRVLTLIVPLITFPYLIKTLGSENYGLVMWAWSIINFFILFINFGFNLSITKHISIHRENKEKISEIVSTTLFAKFILFLFSLIIFILILMTIPKINLYQDLFIYTFMFTFAETMMPIWYFQGIEKMKYTAIITSFIKIFFTVMVFLVIQKEDDYLKVPLLYTLSSAISTIFAYYIIFGKNKVILQRPKISEAYLYIKNSTALFLSNSVSVIKESLSIIIIEQYIGLSAVAFYDIAQKFVNILITPFHIVATVLYPHLAKTKDFKILKRTMLYTGLISILLYCVTVFFNSQIVIFLYGQNNTEIISLLNILAISIIFANLASLLGTNGLVVVGENKKLLWSSLFGAVSFLGILFILTSVNIISLGWIATGVVFGLIVEMASRAYFMKAFLWKK